MKVRPRNGLQRVLDHLGTNVIQLVHGDPRLADDIGGIVIYDPSDEPLWPNQALVLGVGLSTPEQVAAALIELSDHDCSGLIVRAPAPDSPAVADAALRSGVALIALTRGTSWGQLATMVRAVLDEDHSETIAGDSLGGVPSGDLFALANAVAALLDAPITIEDRSSRVLAFSGRQDEADRSRVDTILGRRVPDRSVQQLHDRGIFTQLYRSPDPVVIPPPPDRLLGFTVQRVAIAVRAGEEILGSVWAAMSGPLDDALVQSFREVGKLVALHLLSNRVGSDVQRRFRADLLGSVLDGGPGAAEAASKLGLGDGPAVVAAMAIADPAEDARPGPDAAKVAALHRATDALGMHLMATRRGAVTAIVDDIAYAVVPTSAAPKTLRGSNGSPNGGADADDRVTQAVTDFVTRVGNSTPVIIGIGARAGDLAGLPGSRASADRALRVLRADATLRSVARIDEVLVDALLIELGDLVSLRGDRPGDRLLRLIRYDVEQKACLVETLQAWLDAFGDIPAAAASVGVHVSTYRYRLRRAVEVSRIDLDDPDQRFDSMLQLKLIKQLSRNLPLS